MRENMISKKRFARPPKTSRPSPFWAWNDRLEPAELRRQIQLMKQQGYGGFFMHSRVGLDTDYLSTEWFRAIRACYQSAHELDMEAWLYDEDKWPSGAAGGLVTRSRPDLAPKGLAATRIEASQLASSLRDPATLAVYALRRAGTRRLVSATRVRKGDRLGGELWRFAWQAQQPSNWYNGATYIDTLDPTAVAAFLKVTHDAYQRRVGRYFGPHMPGIFTDEPHYRGAIGVGRGGQGAALPYTIGLPEYLAQQTGMDLAEVLPDLFFDSPRSATIRYAYFRCVTQRFLESFTIPYAQRCSRYGLAMTGHMLLEDDLVSQVSAIGSAMPHYWYMHAPGVDHLLRRHDHLLTHRQCSSVAHQAGHQRVLSELFGVSGQDMSFEDQKWIGDYHLVNGVNLFCPHLMLYSMVGDNKRDYPPTFSYHQPYFSRMRVVNDYFARVSHLLSQGRPVADVLLLHSIGSAWSTVAPLLNDKGRSIEPDMAQPTRLSKQLDGALVSLVGDHRDVHLGDELLLEQFGRVRGKQLVCGKMAYSVVVVPPSKTWHGKTVEMLERFAVTGGRLVFVSPTPKQIDGRPAAARWRQLLGRKGVSVVPRQKLTSELAKSLPRGVGVEDSTGRQISDIRHAGRVDGKKRILFFCNVSRTRTYRASIRLDGRGRVEKWDPATGAAEPVPSRRIGRHTVVDHEFAPVGSLLLVVDASRRPVACRRQKPRRLRSIPLNGPWTFRHLHPNSMTLDFCRLRVGQARFSRTMPVWQVRHRLYEQAGLKPYVGIQPWALRQLKVKPKPLAVTLRFDFASDLDAPDVALVVERLERFDLRVNGQHVRSRPDGWHWDRQFGKVTIGKWVRRGRNRIELSARYALDTPIEDIYLVGRFATRALRTGMFALCTEPQTLSRGDWCGQGYHFYCGNMLYTADVELPARLPGRAVLQLRRPMGCAFAVHVDGHEVGTIAWQPWQIDLTGAVHPGVNRIGIEVVGTLRNTFGPLHHTQRDPCYWWGPQAFVDRDHWTGRYRFVPYGLGGARLELLSG